MSLWNWRQFRRVEIEFHNRLTIITGANGSGKSTLLNILAAHFGWPRKFLATPTYSKKLKSYEYIIDRDSENIALEDNDISYGGEPTTTVGTIRYADGKRMDLELPRNPHLEYEVVSRKRAIVEGVYISPHRPAQKYQRVDQIPTEPMLANIALDQWLDTVRSIYYEGSANRGPYFRMKQALISMAMFGPSNSFSPGIPAVRKTFNGFIEVLHNILPDTLGFRTLSIRTPDVVVVTDAGEWVIDDASGGISALIELAWQIFLYSNDRHQFVAVIDEPENHLHPSMQRVVMSKLLQAFPNVQFIVATHSPFVVSSVKDSAVYALRYQRVSGANISAYDQSDIHRTNWYYSLLAHQKMIENSGFLPPSVTRRIYSEKLDMISRTGNASEVLRDVLGVPVTTPDWVITEVKNIVTKYRKRAFTTETLTALRAELEELGMADQFPAAVAKLAE